MRMTPSNYGCAAICCGFLTVFGCTGERDLPHSPVSEVLAHPPAEVTSENVGEWTFTANGTNILDGVTVVRGSTVELALDSSLSEKIEQERPHTIGFIEVLMLPQGATDEEWETFDHSMRWGASIKDVTDHGEIRVDAEPGVYDARIYFKGFNRYEDDILLELIGKTTVTVTE